MLGDMNMGSLEPGATYIYERDGSAIYARKFGETDRITVGLTLGGDSPVLRQYQSQINAVLVMCETDPAMRELLDQLFVLYNLKKTNSTIDHHPV